VLFLADESCDAAVIRALRAAGHDVRAVAESSRGATDLAILEAALTEQRVLLTKDKDFGELVFTGARVVPVMLLRFPPAVRSLMPQAVLEVVRAFHNHLQRSFIVLTPAGARISRLPFD
jgi:predicted nuclease of predicted toxin-antitoxin system